MNLISHLLDEFSLNHNPKIAFEQSSYLKNQFAFFGIKTTERRSIQKPFLDKQYLPPKTELASIVKTLWDQPQRECHYFAQELVEKYAKGFEEQDLNLFEFMITHQSWWDTVDFIATHLVGSYFKQFPEKRYQKVEEWLASGNIWLQRTAILFQLKYQKALDVPLLENSINKLLGSKEFFINKAIGWMLREYSKTNAEWVSNFLAVANLSGLSRREASKYL
ncbi:MAG TPA: DNA alkylation repair protein [Niabella sp.]|nr:DNA alkylation repair protein [Niabella sp.]HOZ96076.1 DNA alkylation repair protein [Niabella sp.]HQW13442.1 DNA alkylation repair protein [Niabella sp.]HQX18836.1 DNA alkylation repair protein [Niabella sp.]HQX42466.1 DNA alkylation repair protein [Niabella sp.]